MLIVVTTLLSCWGSGVEDDEGDEGPRNSGWLNILEPIAYGPYNSATSVVHLSGSVFTVHNSTLFVYASNWTTGDEYQVTNVTSDGTNTFWSVDVTLNPGENIIYVGAYDGLGNSGSDQIVIDNSPKVVSVTPRIGSVVTNLQAVSVTFSEPMDVSTINAYSFSLNDGDNYVAGDISFSDQDTVAVFTPSSSLSYDTTYTVTLSSAVRDPDGISIAAATWSFDLIEFVPTNLRASGGDGQVVLHWDYLPGALYYNIYFGTNPDFTIAGGTLISGVNSITYTHSGLTNGEKYYYLVTAVDNLGESVPSNKASTMAGLVFDQISSDYGAVESMAIETDTNGNCYIVGQSEGPFNFTLPPWSQNAFIAKYDAYGSRTWIRQFGSDLNEYAYDIAVDGNENVYVVGQANNVDFMAKFDPSGHQLWIKDINIGTEHSYAIDVDENGYPYVAGDANNAGSFLAKFDTNGFNLWISYLEAPYVSEINDIAVDSDGNSTVVGHTSTGNSSQDGKVFIAKYDTSGNQIWSGQIDSSADDYAYGLSVDSAGNNYVVGHTYGDFVGSGNAGESDVFLAKFDAMGNSLWVKQFGTVKADYGRGVAINAVGNIYVIGHTDGDLDGAGNAGTGINLNYDVFMAGYDTDGAAIWIKQFGTPSVDWGMGIKAGGNGEIVITGHTGGDLTGTGDGSMLDAYIGWLYP